MIKKIKKILLKFSFVRFLAINRFKKKFRRKNPQNYVEPLNVFNLNNVEIGKYSYGNLFIKEFAIDNEKLIIGSYCSIADNVTFLLSGEHNYKRISTYPFKTKLFGEKEECFGKGPIIIKDDVWIGYGATILSGVTIGQGAIVGAGSIVATDIPPYAIYANGKVLKYRFSEDIIKKLEKLDYNKLNFNKVENSIKELYAKITEENVDMIIKDLMDDEG